VALTAKMLNNMLKADYEIKDGKYKIILVKRTVYVKKDNVIILKTDLSDYLRLSFCNRQFIDHLKTKKD
jgi:hypothetical protein